MVIRNEKQLCRGDSCNTQYWELANHYGTHVDVPRHFFDSAQTVDSFPPTFWVCENPLLVSCSLQPGEVVEISSIDTRGLAECDCLLIRTGFESRRGQETYWRNNPGLSPELGKWLRQNSRGLRFVGFDFISLSPFSNRALGREAHRAFLDPKGEGNPICLIEDMSLGTLMGTPKKVIIAPLRVEGSDGAPVTVLGEIQ